MDKEAVYHRPHPPKQFPNRGAKVRASFLSTKHYAENCAPRTPILHILWRCDAHTDFTCPVAVRRAHRFYMSCGVCASSRHGLVVCPIPQTAIALLP